MRYNKQNPLKVFTAFSGYDSQCMALDRLKKLDKDFDYELVGWSEIDPYAIKAHNILYPQYRDRNFGDISKINWGGQVPDFDLFTYSFPCQSISNSGLQHGFKEGSGTRSSLLWECRKAIVAKHPKYLLMENVKALVSKKFIQDFYTWLLELEGYGYVNYWQVLNATDYGVPQNRERVFCVSVLKTEEDPIPVYQFPHPFQLDKRLKDVIEKSEDGTPVHVDEKYYLTDKALEYFNRTSECKEHNHNFSPKKKRI